MTEMGRGGLLGEKSQSGWWRKVEGGLGVLRVEGIGDALTSESTAAMAAVLTDFGEDEVSGDFLCVSGEIKWREMEGAGKTF